MYISNIKLWNFRKFGSDDELNIDKPNLDLNFSQGLNVIIGENDSGKSAIIDAIKLVLKTHSYDYIRAENRDFYKDSERFRVELTFHGLTSDEAKNFTEWLSWTGEGEKAIPFLKLSYDVRRQGKRILPSDVKAGVDDEGYLLTAEAKEYLKATYLKPLRDAENELVAKRNSRLAQILLGHEAFKGKEENNELVEIFKKLKEDLEKYFKGEFEFNGNKPTDGKKIKDTIDGYIKSFYGAGNETEFSATSSDIKSILEKLTLILKDDPNPGLGTFNRLFMAAELLHLNKVNWTGLRLGLIEEMEAHLHPQAQMQVIEAFQKQKSIQLILTTHSPNLASKVKLENLVICNNGKAFPMGKDYTKLKGENYKFLEKFLDTTKSNLFFAKGIILVEGWAEEILIPSIAKAIGVNLTERGVSIVNIGHTGFDHYSKIFLRQAEPYMAIPVAVITDVDVREYKKKDDEYVKRNCKDIEEEKKKKQEKKNQSEQSVKYFIAKDWTLEFALYKSTYLTSEFQRIVKEIHSGTDWSNDFEKELACKLINKGLKKPEIAYMLASAIDEDLEKQVNSIHISDDEKDAVNYLVKAIKHAAGV